MKNPTKQELIARLELMQKQCAEMLEMVEQTLPDKEWYTTAEAAKLASIKPKTATNYCASGVWQRTKKQGRNWLVHKSELD